MTVKFLRNFDPEDAGVYVGTIFIDKDGIISRCQFDLKIVLLGKLDVFHFQILMIVSKNSVTNPTTKTDYLSFMTFARSRWLSNSKNRKQRTPHETSKGWKIAQNKV